MAGEQTGLLPPQEHECGAPGDLRFRTAQGIFMATKAIDAPRKTNAGLKTNQRRIRKIFGNIHEISEMPNLIEVQRESYEQFLRSDPSIGYVSGLE
jgi:hypothetical protein